MNRCNPFDLRRSSICEAVRRTTHPLCSVALVGVLLLGCAPPKTVKTAPVAPRPDRAQPIKPEPKPKPQLPFGTRWVDKTALEMAVKRWKEPDGRPRVVNVLHALDFGNYNVLPEVRDVQLLSGNMDEDRNDELILRIDMAGAHQQGASGDDRCYLAVLDPFNDDPQKLILHDAKEYALKILTFESITETTVSLSLKSVHNPKVQDLIIEQYSKVTTNPQGPRTEQSRHHSVEVQSYDEQERIVRFSWEFIASAGQEQRQVLLPKTAGDRISITDSTGRTIESYRLHPTSGRYVSE